MSPVLIIALLLVCASIFVNGWTDAPNAIATVVSTRVLSPRVAVVMATVFNLIGIMCFGSAVASTIANLVDVGTGSDPLIAICAAQLSIVIWSVSAWKFGIPTSESHALHYLLVIVILLLVPAINLSSMTLSLSLIHI